MLGVEAPDSISVNNIRRIDNAAVCSVMHNYRMLRFETPSR